VRECGAMCVTARMKSVTAFSRRGVSPSYVSAAADAAAWCRSSWCNRHQLVGQVLLQLGPEHAVVAAAAFAAVVAAVLLVRCAVLGHVTAEKHSGSSLH
jgi:hypothetical protein